MNAKKVFGFGSWVLELAFWLDRLIKDLRPKTKNQSNLFLWLLERSIGTNTHRLLRFIP